MNILMTVEELAKYLKLKPDTIYKKVRKGELPAIKLGKLLRFPKELIDQWVAEQMAKTAKAKMIVEDVVGTVNEKAKAASRVISEDVSHIIEDVKKASLSHKTETLKKGLQDLWLDLNKEMVLKKKTSAKSGSKKRPKVAKPASRHKKGLKKKVDLQSAEAVEAPVAVVQ